MGKVLVGTEVVRNLNGEYGDGAPNGNGPPQHKIRNGGMEYMNKNFPNLDSFITCSVDTDADDAGGSEEEKADGDDDDATNPDKAEEEEEEEVDAVAKDAEDTALVARTTAVEAKKRLGLGNGNGNADGDGDATSNIHVPIIAAVLVFLAIVLTMRRRRKKVETKMG